MYGDQKNSTKLEVKKKNCYAKFAKFLKGAIIQKEKKIIAKYVKYNQIKDFQRKNKIKTAD